MVNVQKTVVKNKGVGFLGLLTLMFVAAKLFGVINWSWALVFLPIYLFPVIALAALFISGIAGVILFAVSNYSQKKMKKANKVG